MPDLIGQSLGRYHILEQLGAPCGYATRRVAWRLSTKPATRASKRTWRVKVIRTENILPSTLERSLKRFEREPGRWRG